MERGPNMRSMISRVFSRRPGGPASPMGISVVSSELSTGDIENYYLRIIGDCLRRMLVPADTINVRVKRSGTDPSGLIAYSGYVRILKWDPIVMPVLLKD